METPVVVEGSAGALQVLNPGKILLDLLNFFVPVRQGGPIVRWHGHVPINYLIT